MGTSITSTSDATRPTGPHSNDVTRLGRSKPCDYHKCQINAGVFIVRTPAEEHGTARSFELLAPHLHQYLSVVWSLPRFVETFVHATQQLQLPLLLLLTEQR